MSSSDLSEWESEDDTPTLVKPTFKSKTEEAEWERKQRNREYRVAARREKRNRKADEKKQRKLNATILRRMTKNPGKYNKNTDRNRRRDIEMERRKIYNEAVSQAERLAAIHDPTGKLFNVGPVVIQDDGKVVSVEYQQRRARAQAERAARLIQSDDVATAQRSNLDKSGMVSSSIHLTDEIQDIVNPARHGLIKDPSENEVKSKQLSKNQQKKLALLEERPPPPKPAIPDWIKLPEGEENWLALWNLSDDELERRVIREKRRKAAERKALREKQKEGKTERRAARDERRRIYREKKLEWKAIKEQEKVQKRRLLRVEQEEAKRIEVEVNTAERRRAMEICAELGFTLNNVEGVAEIKPKALGMKGQEVDFDIFEIGDRASELRIKEENKARELQGGKVTGNRVDLGKVQDESKTKAFTSDSATPAGLEGDFVSLDFGGIAMNGQEFEALNYNHKLRRKLHRAIEAAQIQKELLVRAKAREHCESKGIKVPPELAAGYTPIRLAGRRILENGTFETEKQERVRKRLELAEYNKAAKILRQQAKAEAIEAGLRVFAELTGKKASVAINPLHSQLDDAKSLGVNYNNTENSEKPAAENSKKRRREGEESKTKNVKKSKHSPALVNASAREATEGDEQQKEARNENRLGLNTLHVPGASLSQVFGSKEPSSNDEKRKRAHEHENKAKRSIQFADEKVIRQEKRFWKEKKQERAKDKDTSRDAQSSTEALEALSKEQKMSKRQKTKTVRISGINGTELKESPEETHQVVEGVLNIKNGYQWNPDALVGDRARKNKFLRLLGGSKASEKSPEKASNKVKTKSDTAEIVQMQTELERQFVAGIRMKHGGQGKKGLGA